MSFVSPLTVWHFDEFVLDLPRYELRRNGIAVRVEPQVFDVMTQLVTNHQRLVTKTELLDAVWGGRFVTEGALTSRIKAARHALGDDGGTQRYIRTVRGRGYQFVGFRDRAVHRQSALDLAPATGRVVVADAPALGALDDVSCHGTTPPHQRRSPSGQSLRRRAVVLRRIPLHGPPHRLS